MKATHAETAARQRAKAKRKADTAGDKASARDFESYAHTHATVAYMARILALLATRDVRVADESCAVQGLATSTVAAEHSRRYARLLPLRPACVTLHTLAQCANAERRTEFPFDFSRAFEQHRYLPKWAGQEPAPNESPIDTLEGYHAILHAIQHGWQPRPIADVIARNTAPRVTTPRDIPVTRLAPGSAANIKPAEGGISKRTKALYFARSMRSLLPDPTPRVVKPQSR